jgi:hypothetical protein
LLQAGVAYAYQRKFSCDKEGVRRYEKNDEQYSQQGKLSHELRIVAPQYTRELWPQIAE